MKTQEMQVTKTNASADSYSTPLMRPRVARCSTLFCMLLALMNCMVLNAQRNLQGTKKPAPADSSAIEERLVALALKGPQVLQAEHQNKINELQLKAARNTWVNILSLSANYNDQSFKQNTSTTAYVYPKYFFGLTVPLGTVLSRTNVKAAQESIEISKNNQEQLKRTIRADILSRYREYKAYGELIAIQTELLNDIQAALAQTEDKFKKGTVSIDIYNTAQKGKNDEVAKLINLQLQQDLVKLEIEKMIGTSLESVLK